MRVYSGASYTLRFTATVSGFSGGYAGYRSDNRTVCELMRLGDAWTYEPYERFDVVMPDGTTKSYGRISRSNCTWDSEFQVFTLTSDVEESSTRSEDISMDYDFFHSDDMTSLSCGNDYQATVIPVDINIWISRLFLGDADGFSILYYQDVDSLVYWANEAAYRWNLRGMCIPEGWVETVLGSNNPFGVILATLVGIPMYADIFGTIPIAEALLAKGALLGTILSFMMAVTTLSLPSLIMLKKAIKPKLLTTFIVICTVGIIIVGYGFNVFQSLFI